LTNAVDLAANRKERVFSPAALRREAKTHEPAKG
jgi:hypothetical protein